MSEDEELYTFRDTRPRVVSIRSDVSIGTYYSSATEIDLDDLGFSFNFQMKLSDYPTSLLFLYGFDIIYRSIRTRR